MTNSGNPGEDRLEGTEVAKTSSVSGEVGEKGAIALLGRIASVFGAGGDLAVGLAEVCSELRVFFDAGAVHACLVGFDGHQAVRCSGRDGTRVETVVSLDGWEVG